MKQTRRSFIRQCAAAGATLLAGVAPTLPALAATGRKLTLHGPPAGPSVILVHVAESNGLADLVSELRFDRYRNPDMVRTGFVTGRWELAATPSYVAANLGNRGVPVRLMNIMTWGLLYVISAREDVAKIEDLRGETVAMPFKADMPDLVFQYIARQKGMKAGSDYQLNYVADPFQGLQMLVSGRVDHVVLPEPAATASLLKGAQSGKRLTRAISLQQSWGEVTGGPAAIPQAGMTVRESLLEEMPGLPARLNAAITRSTEWVVSNPAKAGRLAQAHLGVKAPMIERSIPHGNFRLRTAGAARPEIERFYTILAETNPAIIGGRLPDASFYLD